MDEITIQPICDVESLPPGLFDIPPQTDHMMKALGIFTFTHPKWRDAFVDCSRQDVLYTILTKLQKRHMSVLLTVDNSIGGYIIYTPDRENKVLYVEHILGYARDLMRAFAVLWIKEYPEWTIVANRRNKRKQYDFTQFISRYF